MKNKILLEVSLTVSIIKIVILVINTVLCLIGAIILGDSVTELMGDLSQQPFEDLVKLSIGGMGRLFTIILWIVLVIILVDAILNVIASVILFNGIQKDSKGCVLFNTFFNGISPVVFFICALTTSDFSIEGFVISLITAIIPNIINLIIVILNITYLKKEKGCV